MRSTFIGRELEISQIDELFEAKSGGLFSLYGENGSGKTFLLKKLRHKYRHSAQIYLNCNPLPVVESAIEFLLFLGQLSTGFKNFEKAVKVVEEHIQHKHKITHHEELLLLEALSKDCKLHPIIFVDSYETLLNESQIYVQKIESHYCKLDKQIEIYKENIAYNKWLIRLLQYLKQQGALLIIAGVTLDAWQRNQNKLSLFNHQEILKFARTVGLKHLIEENHIAVAKILSLLSFNGNPLWLKLACHFLLLEMKNGKNLIQLINTTEVIEDFFLIFNTEIESQNLTNNTHNCKLALFKRVMPPPQEKLWIMALPRHLDDEIFNCLFGSQGEILRYALDNFGLLTSSSTDKNSFVLHNEIKKLLLNHAQSQHLLRGTTTKNTHRNLAGLYQKRHFQQGFKNDDVLIEQLYHQLMANYNAEVELEHIDRPQLLITLIKALEEGEAYIQMSQVFFRLISINPNHDEAWYSLGISLSKQGYFKEAIVAYQKQLHINPKHEPAWKNMGFAFYQTGEVENAVNAYQKKLSITPEYFDSWDEIATTLFQKNKLQRSVDGYRQKIFENPVHETAYYNLGVALKKMGRLKEAIDAYKKQLEINPRHERAWNNLGTSFFQQGSYAEAKTAFSKALNINPTYLYALSNDAELALVQNDKKRCLQHIEEILGLVGNQTEEFVICRFLTWLGSPEESYQAILEGIETRQPSNYFDWNFDSLEAVIQRLPQSKQTIARNFISYFSNNLSFPALQESLKEIDTVKLG